MKTNIVNNTCTLHGVALEIFGLGIIITGPSGIGKSELLLELVSRGHKFIADDLVTIKFDSAKAILFGEQEPFIHIRGMGFVNIAKIYGVTSVIKEANLDLIVELTNLSDMHHFDPIETPHKWTKFDEVAIRTFNLEVIKNRSLTILIELLVKHQQNFLNGYDSHQEFLRYQETLISEAKNAINSN